MLKKLLGLLSDAAIYGLSGLLTQLIGFLLLPLYTHYLTPAEMGTVRMVIIVTSLFGPLANLGMVNAIFRRFNLDKERLARGQILSTGLVSVSLTSLVLLIVLVPCAPWLSQLAVGNVDAASLIRLNLLTGAATSLGSVPLAILRADRHVKTTAMTNVARVLLSVCCTIWLVVIRRDGVWGVVVGTLVGEGTATLFLFGIVFRAFCAPPSLAVWRRLAAYGLPMLPHQIQGMAMALLPQYSVGPLLGLGEAGLYDMATKLTLPIFLVVNSVQGAWLAYKFQIHAEDDDPATFFRTAVTYYVAGVMYLWVGVSLWGPELIWLMTEKNYHPAALLVPICGLIPVAQGIYFMMGTGLELSENTLPYPLVTFAGLVAAVASIYTFVPPLGATGAAISSINSFLVLTIVIYYFSQRRFRIHYDWPALLSFIGLAVGVVVLARQAINLPTIERVGLSIIISLAFPAVEFAVLSRSSTERHRMQYLWDKLRRKRSSAFDG
ncbi:MAG TPA: lipopolysaccharide biosynthesis protein [Pirellulales bacterium]|jgi:O-antigen/teichoic acid export membrane protein|nr:lipopolysaccharide biosynthesis protein [Pirellulales bacterium]